MTDPTPGSLRMQATSSAFNITKQMIWVCGNSYLNINNIKTEEKSDEIYKGS